MKLKVIDINNKPKGEIELDGIRHRVGPLSAIYIAPGVRHRAIGRMRVINIPIPVNIKFHF
mgnify:CR=1 FL=1